MKRIKFIAVLVLLIGFAFSCEDPEPPKPACEVNKTGTVLVENNTGYTGEFDVTWGDVVENYEKTLYDGKTYLYTEIPASGHPESDNGQIELWVRLTVGGGVWTDWMFNVEYLSPCEEMEYRWYLSSSKSTSLNVMIEVTKNGEVVGNYPMTEFKSGGKKANR